MKDLCLTLGAVVCSACIAGEATSQEARPQTIEKALREFQEARAELLTSFVELGPSVIGDLENVAKGEDKETGRVAQKAIDEIRQHEKKLKELVVDLGSSDVDVREKAMMELGRIGRRATWAVKEAVNSSDAEVKMRAQFLVLVVASSGKHPAQDRSYWAARRDVEEKEVQTFEGAWKLGKVSESELTQAQLRLLRAQVGAGDLKSQEYFEAKHKILEKHLEQAEANARTGRGTQLEVLRARIHLLYMQLHLGKATREELWKEQWKASEMLRAFVQTGRMPSTGEGRLILELQTDPDIDLGDVQATLKK